MLMRIRKAIPVHLGVPDCESSHRVKLLSLGMDASFSMLLELALLVDCMAAC
jgi:hypothetical protein